MGKFLLAGVQQVFDCPTWALRPVWASDAPDSGKEIIPIEMHRPNVFLRLTA
jgi:hypothetical protein